MELVRALGLPRTAAIDPQRSFARFGNSPPKTSHCPNKGAFGNRVNSELVKREQYFASGFGQAKRRDDHNQVGACRHNTYGLSERYCVT